VTRNLKRRYKGYNKIELGGRHIRIARKGPLRQIAFVQKEGGKTGTGNVESE